ncbi:MAG: ABC transporter ATP-binding protein [Deltaproteobacteria bacterium]|nr:ABC transporter ATP-binding protein [Deltaproteobacteria bacterium]
MLSVENLTVAYGAITALRNVSLVVDTKEIVTLIGANGAGKTTLLRTLSGLLQPSIGTIHFNGENLSGKSPHLIVRSGISCAPEGRGIFPNLSVEDNLELGAFIRKDSKGIQKDKDFAFTLFPILKERRRQWAGTLSGGEQQMLTISRALMARPKLLLLDEPSLGLAPQVMKQIFSVIQSINAEGTTILLVEQNANMALHIAHRAYVLETGRIVLTDKAQALLNHPDVKKAYLGT